MRRPNNILPGQKGSPLRATFYHLNLITLMTIESKREIVMVIVFQAA